MQLSNAKNCEFGKVHLYLVLLPTQLNYATPRKQLMTTSFTHANLETSPAETALAVADVPCMLAAPLPAPEA